MSMVTPAELRAYLDQLPNTTEINDRLEAILASAESIVTEALGFEFADYSDTATTNDVMTEGDSQWLCLPPYKPGSLTTVVSVSNYGLSTEDTSEVTGYVVQPKFYLYSLRGWGVAQWYRVTAKWGYGPAPDAIKQVVKELAVNIWRSRDKGSFSELIGPDGGGQAKVVGGLTTQQRGVIESVRRRFTQPFY